MSNTIQFIRLGMLGGGQLGRMLLQKAADFDLRIAVLDPDPEAPCRYLCEEFVCGNFRDYQTVYDFGKKCDLMTIEIEHVNTEALFQLQKEGVKIHPSPEIIQLVQDKGLQKEFYKKHSIPTADFVLIENKSEISKHSSGFPWMQKLRKGGYDGKGVQPLKSATDLTAAFDAPSILEKMIPFTKEIAVIVSRNDKGDVACFPSVEMEFNPEANLVEFLSSPAHISKAVEEKAESIATHLANELKLVGVLAVEFFLTANDELLVNEIAPRPHNSGHQTIEGNITSQYEQHLRAIYGMPLGNTSIVKPSVMINLLGEKNYSGNVLYEGMDEALKIPGVHVHLYGKKITKPFRKMGHVTVVNDSAAEAHRIARKLLSTIRVIAQS